VGHHRQDIKSSHSEASWCEIPWYRCALNMLVRWIIYGMPSNSFILDCQNYFNVPYITVSQQQRKYKFFKTLAASENSLCQSLRSFAQRELNSLDHL